MAVLDANDPLGAPGHFGVVRDEHNGVTRAVKLVENFKDFTACFFIEIAGRLVGQDQRGFDRDGAGDGAALLLAAG